jgi:SdiA-regulated
MPSIGRTETWLLIVLLTGVALHFVPPVPSGPRAPTAAASAAPPSAAGLLARYDLTQSGAVQHRLPKRLEEVSGLAATGDGRLLAHNDERGLISEVDPTTGDVRNAFAIVADGEPIAADFEGIAVLDDRVYVATSDGVIYDCPQGADGENVTCESYDTGLGSEYELESVGSDVDRRELVLVSKRPRSPALAGLVGIDRWSAQEKRLIAGGRVTVPYAEFTRGLDDDEFEPSSVEVDPATGNYLVLAGPQKALAEVTPQGRVLSVAALPRRLHEQPEGIALTTDGALVIADEGGGGDARLTLYPRRERSLLPAAPPP